jgi:hypothetical protein
MKVRSAGAAYQIFPTRTTGRDPIILALHNTQAKGKDEEDDEALEKYAPSKMCESHLKCIRHSWPFYSSRQTLWPTHS